MAFAHGKLAEVVTDQYIHTNLFKSMNFSYSQDTAESTVFNLNDKTFVAGLRSATLSLDGFYDETRQAEIEARISSATQPIVTAGSAGLAVGARARLIQTNTSNVTETSGIGDLVLLNWSLHSTDRVGLGYCLSVPATSVVTSTNGAAVDTTAAVTAASWTAHFHLHTISATNIVLKVQDSLDGSTGWTDITSVTSGTLTTPSAVRVTGTGNTRRYIRATSTITGGATTAQYTVAFARF